MTGIRTVLATVRYRPEELEQLRQSLGAEKFVHCEPDDDEVITRTLQDADVAVLSGDLDDRYLAAPKLAWIHCDHAGLNGSARPEVFDRGLLVTGSAGRSAAALAQHAFYFAMTLLFDTRALYIAQKEHRWGGPPDIGDKLSLWGMTLGVVGLGHTGTEMAKLGRAMGMRVVAYRRSADQPGPDVDALFSADAGYTVQQLLEESDVVMLAINLSDATHHLIGAAEFGHMKPTAILVNMARGEIVDERALITALSTGRIAGAGLDVFEREPLPPTSPLWTMDNVILTPHATPRLPDRTGRSLAIIAENARRYRCGEPLLNLITPRDVYTAAGS